MATPVTTLTQDVRTVKTRASATALLKKLGIAVADYGNFITKAVDADDERPYAVDLGAARQSLVIVFAAKKMPARKVKGVASCDGPDIDETEALAAAAKPAKPAKAPRAVKRTVTSVALELIRAGQSNAEVFAALQAEFNLDDGKKSYPAWYRRHLRVRFGETYAEPAGSIPAKAPKAAPAGPALSPAEIVARDVAQAAVKKAAKARRVAA